MVDTLTGGAMAIVIVVGGAMVLDQSLDIGVMVAFLFYVQRFFDPIRSLTLQYSTMQRAMASGQRIFEVTDVDVEVKDRDDAEDPEEIDGSIEFRDVTFGYEAGNPILKNISFNVSPGETIALVGPTGSGKTSTTSLVHRFYDTWEGDVLVGGQNVRDVTRFPWPPYRDGPSGAVPLFRQHRGKYPLREDGRYLDDVVAAAKVGAHEFIMRLEAGYQTQLDQRGINLFGQRQLISFARALVADAKILCSTR